MIRSHLLPVLTLLLSISCFVHLHSQTIDSLEFVIDEITVTSTRIENKLVQLPMAASVSSSSAINFVTSQRISLQEFIKDLPGVFSLNANNYAQDLRISIRGFGTRSAFGIRGIKLVVDGIPETSPDGQGQLDNLDLNNIERIETLRGPASGLYGNASGGVIKIRTLDAFENNFLKAGLSYGAFNALNAQVAGGINLTKSQLILNANYFKSDGYRAHSKTETSIFSAKLNTDLSDKTKIRLIANYTSSPLAEDPGGITLENVTSDPTQARDRNINFQTGEELTHLKLGGTIDMKKNNKTFHSSLFYHLRQFDGRLPFEFGGLIDLSRNFFGHSSYVQWDKQLKTSDNKLLLGYNVHFQNDDRKRYRNLLGTKGDETLNQVEQFYNYAFYLTDNLRLKEKTTISLEGRLDFNRVGNEDHFLSDGDDSSSTTYSNFNFGYGMSYKFSSILIPYLRIASSFELPTLSELSALPSSGGFNKALKPIKSYNYELGIKGNTNNYLTYQSCFFYIRSSNEILPFELEDFPDRDFFRNAGTTSRVGAELSFSYEKPDAFSGNLSYTWSHFRFQNYELNGDALKDNKLPGLPDHLVVLDLNYPLCKNFCLSSTTQYVGNFFADNNNEVKIKHVLVSNFKFLKTINTSKFQLFLLGGVNNLFDTSYFDNIRINAFGRRYYEGAAGRHLYLGFRVMK